MFKQLFKALLLTLIWLLPDILMQWLSHGHYIHPKLATLKAFPVLWILAFLILSIPKFWIRYAFAAFITLLSIAQALHFSYFHAYIKPYEIPLLFSQMAEIQDTLSDTWRFFIAPLALFAVQLGLLYWLLKRSALTFRYATAIVLVLLLAGPVVAHKRKRAYVFMPKAHAFGVVNSYTVLSWYLGKELFKHKTKTHFKPYKIEPLSITPPHTIVVIMGESMNKKYMSLFGYPKKSTPRLDSLKNNPHFLYNWGFSGGVTTDVSVPTFFLLKREPTNANPLIDNITNLARLAKTRGYKVTFITMQNPMLLSGYIGGYTDKLISIKGYDEKLLKALDKIDFSKKNFIILHQRNSHSPYEKYTPKRFYHFPFQGLDFHNYMLGSYLNSLRYTDYIVTSVFEKIESLKDSGVVFFTSDHGEMMGDSDEERGRYGHVVLDFADAKVPLLIYYHNVDPKLVPYLEEVKKIKSHYQFGKIIANALGYKVINPNENGKFFINGVDILGETGYLEY